MRNMLGEVLDQETCHSNLGESRQLLPWLCLLGHKSKACLAEKFKFSSWMCPWRGFLQGIHGTAQGRSNLPLHSKISTKAPELFQSSISNINIGTRGKKLPRGGYRATNVPWRTRKEEKEQQPSGWEAEHSAKLEMGRPGAKVAALFQGWCLFCPCFICPRATWDAFFSPVINLQVSWALNNLVFANVYFEFAVSVH